jgi:hypothetical protein
MQTKSFSVQYKSDKRKLSLAQMVRFLVVESIHLCSNPRFDVGVIYLRLILSVVDNILVDSETLFDRFREF